MKCNLSTLLTSLLAFLSAFCVAQEIPLPHQTNALSPDTKKILQQPLIATDVTLSECKQFRVSGSDARVRSGIVFLAEGVKKNLLAICDEKDQWKTSITFLLHGKAGDPLKPRSIVFEFGFDENEFKLIVNAHLAQGVDEVKFRSAVIMALLYEKALRGKKPGPMDTGLIVRPWLVEGIAEMLDWKSGKRDRRVYKILFESGGIYEAETLLAITQPQYDDYDEAMRSAFRTSSGALVMALLEQPEGKRRFLSFLSEAALFGGDISLSLRKHFVNLNLSTKSLDKWWSLQMANMSRNSLEDVITISDSEIALKNALSLEFIDDEGKNQIRDFSSWQDFLTLNDTVRTNGIRQAQEKLTRLSYRCFPSYRNLIEEYQAVLQNLVTKKSLRQLGEKIEALEKRRALMLQRATRATDYLDWYEITRASDTSGAFDDYIKLKQRLHDGVNRKEDYVSKYLNRVQKLYERGKK